MNYFKFLTYEQNRILIESFSFLIPSEEKKIKIKTEVAEIIKEHQKRKNYTDKIVVEKVNYLIDEQYEKNRNKDKEEKAVDAKYLDENTFRKIKSRNTQKSHPSTNYLALIAQVLDFDVKEYEKYFTAECYAEICQEVSRQSCRYNTLMEVYEQLNPNEQSAMVKLAEFFMKQNLDILDIDENIELLEKDSQEDVLQENVKEVANEIEENKVITDELCSETKSL